MKEAYIKWKGGCGTGTVQSYRGRGDDGSDRRFGSGVSLSRGGMPSSLACRSLARSLWCTTADCTLSLLQLAKGGGKWDWDMGVLQRMIDRRVNVEKV